MVKSNWKDKRVMPTSARLIMTSQKKQKRRQHQPKMSNLNRNRDRYSG
jgi:hypothetical protein